MHHYKSNGSFPIVTSPCIQDICVNLRELILSRQRQSKFTKDLEMIPAIIRKFSKTLRYFKAKMKFFDQKYKKNILQSTTVNVGPLSGMVRNHVYIQKLLKTNKHKDEKTCLCLFHFFYSKSIKYIYLQ